MSKKQSRETIQQRTSNSVIPDDPHIKLDEYQTAKLLNCSVHKLRRDRWAGDGIPFIKLTANGSVRYDRAAIHAYLLEHSCTSTSVNRHLFGRKAGSNRKKREAAE